MFFRKSLLLLFVGFFLVAQVPQSEADELTLGAVFSSAQSQSQSFLRFYNSGGFAGTAVITLKDFTSGQTLGQWTTPSISPGAEIQYPITTVEDGTGAPFTKPSFYTVEIEPNYNGAFQHVLWKPSDGTLTNLSTCAGGVTTTNTNVVIGVHSSLLNSGYPSTIIITNQGTAAAAAELTIYDARDGANLGTYTTPQEISAGGQRLLSVSTIETSLGLTPSGTQYHYNIRLTSDLDGFLQHTMNNQQVAVIVDMTALCTLTATTSSTTTSFEGAVSGSTETGVLSLTIDTEVDAPTASAQLKSAATSFETQSAISTASGTFTPKGGTAVSLTGTYDSTSRAVNVSGSGTTFTGSVESDAGDPRFSGEYTSATSTGRVEASKQSATLSPINYCGSLTITNEDGTANATFSFTITGTTVRGNYSDPEGGSGRLIGTLSGTTINSST